MVCRLYCYLYTYFAHLCFFTRHQSLPLYPYGLGARKIIFSLYLLIYKSFNQPVLGSLWPKWRQERYRLFAPIPQRTYGSGYRPNHPEAGPFNDTRKNRCRPPRPLGYDAERRNTLRIAAMKDLFRTNPDNEIDPSIRRFFHYWFTPALFSYLALIACFACSILSSTAFGLRDWAIEPTAFLIQISLWLLLSLYFIYRQAPFLNQTEWQLTSRQLNMWPVEIRTSLRRSPKIEPHLSHPLKGITWRLLLITQTLVFSIFLALLIFYDAAIWKGLSPTGTGNIQFSLFSFTWPNSTPPNPTDPKPPQQ
jgi:hypothetical protein